MFSLRKSFYAQISAIYLGLVLFLGASIAFLGVTSSFSFIEETTQKVNSNLASEFAMEIQPFLNDSIAADSIRQRIQYLKGINPEVDVYLINSSGMIKDYYLAEPIDEELAMAVVDVDPLNRFIDNAELPILGQDPRNPSDKKPFSAANVSIMGSKGCFLYVILKGEEYDEAAMMIGDSYILKSSLLGLALIILSTIGVGLILFRSVTKRLNNMQNVVVAFEQGQLEQRYNVESNDEIASLGHSFNQMADTIVSNMDEIKQVDKLRRELVANVSHDLRSPLSSIQGYLETVMMKEESISAEDRNKYLNIVLDNTKKLNKLVSELFELSKLDAKEVKPEMEQVSVGELAQDLIFQFKPIAEKKNIILKFAEPEESLPLVYADIALMERALGNLIDNAIKHTPEGGYVTIQPRLNNEKVMVNIIDTGEGISEEDLNRIFDRFYQVDQSRATGGAGLGLSIAQKILELHDSKLNVQSVLDKGTTFSFSLSTMMA